VTLVCFSPATTWAAVTTTPGAATQPLPAIPSPQAVPVTRTTLAAAADTARFLAIAAFGAPGMGGPVIDGNGSTRASAFSSRWGGTISFRRWSTFDRWTSCRSDRWPGTSSAAAPTTHPDTNHAQANN